MTYNVAPNFNSEREEFLYESCLKDSDLTELDDFLTNNFGDN